MEKIFFQIDDEDFVVHLIKNNHCKEGEVYPIYKYIDSDGWGYKSDQDGTPTDDAKKARCLFNFLFCWRGVWEGRIYFKDDEYWCEELSTISKLWNEIEIKMKDIIKKELKLFDLDTPPQKDGMVTRYKNGVVLTGSWKSRLEEYTLKKTNNWK